MFVNTSGRIIPQEGLLRLVAPRTCYLKGIITLPGLFSPPTTHHPDLPSVHRIIVASGFAIAIFDV